VEDRRLNQAQRRHGRAAALAGQVEQRGQVVFDAQLGIMERGGGLFAIPGDQVESELRVEDGLREGLEREQTNGLLLEFLHAGHAVLAGGAKIWMTERWMGSCAWSRRRKSARAMAPGCATTLTAEGQGLRPLLGFDQRRAQAGVGAFLGGPGQVDDAAPGCWSRSSERLAAGFRGSGEKDGARAGEAFGVETADQGRLVADQREFAGLLAEGGNQAQFESGRGGAAMSRISRPRETRCQ